MTTDLVPRLRVGPGKPESYVICGMQVISWENGDKKITDFPECSAKPLSRLVQKVNDTVCRHTKSVSGQPTLLCSPCAQTVLDLGHATVGTGEYTQETLLHWLRSLLVDSKYGVIQYVHTRHRPVVHHIADLLADGPRVNGGQWMRARNHANQAQWDGSASEYRVCACNAVAHTAGAAMDVVAVHAGDGKEILAADSAGHAYASACLGGYLPVAMVEYARWAIDEWHRVAGTTPRTPDPAAVTGALERMSAVPVA